MCACLGLMMRHIDDVRIDKARVGLLSCGLIIVLDAVCACSYYAWLYRCLGFCFLDSVYDDGWAGIIPCLVAAYLFVPCPCCATFLQVKSFKQSVFAVLALDEQGCFL